MGDLFSQRFGTAARLALLALPCVGLSVTSARSQPAAPALRLTLEQAVERTLTDNPGLRAAGFAIEAERARRDTAALATPFTLEGELENFAGSGALGGTDRAEGSLQLSRVLERGDKLRLRTELGDSLVARAETEAALARVDLAAEATRRFIQVLVDDERVRLSAGAVELADQTLALVRRRVEVGRSSEAELATAENALAQAALNRESFRRQRAADAFRLGSLWAGTDTNIVLAAADLAELPEVDAFSVMQERIGRSPDLLRLFNEQRVLDAERRVAAARRRSDLTVGVGVRYLADPDDAGLVVSVAMPLGSRERAAPQLNEANARLSRLPALIDQRRLELGAVLFEQVQQLEFERERHARLLADILPRAELSVDLYRQGFELGSISLLEYTEAQRELLNLRQAALAAAANFHLTLIDVEQLLGSIDPEGELR